LQEVNRLRFEAAYSVHYRLMSRAYIASSLSRSATQPGRSRDFLVEEVAALSISSETDESWDWDGLRRRLRGAIKFVEGTIDRSKSCCKTERGVRLTSSVCPLG
jgi:hypothetical protein